MSRGGKREGRPGVLRPNRSDLNQTQPIQGVGDGSYGSVKASEDAQRAIPLQNASGVQAAMAQQAPQPSVYPGELGAFDRPTERPDEPLTQGVPIGPGAGPEALNPGTVDTITSARIRAIYQRYPNEGLRMLIEQLDSES